MKFPDPFEEEADGIIDTVEERAEKKFTDDERDFIRGVVTEILSRAWDDAMDTARERLEELRKPKP
jgi:hypothetical protein